LSQYLTATRLFTPHECVEHPRVTIRDGAIESIEPGEPDASGTTILPGFVDIHIHGAAGVDVMQADQAAFDRLGAFLATRGVVAYLPTTVTAPLDRLLRAVDAIASIIERDRTQGARPLGIHLEGPFISHAKCGVHPMGDILEPSLLVFEQLWQASRGTLKLMTIAPELPKALEVIARAVELGVRVSLGHSNALYAEAQAGIAAGAGSVTHLFNAMRALDHREPGILGAALDGDLYCEFIADGIHVDPAIARLTARVKPHACIILITDAISATGMPDGCYRLGGLEVEVANGQCRHAGRLAGSVLTLDRAVTNFSAFTGLGIGTVAAMATHNPARMLGLDSYGRLEKGAVANFTVRMPDGAIGRTMLAGHWA
jgi:N-acetylglucosamine-6-phosphate deacetylase